MTLFSAALLLFLVMDPFGNVPVFLAVVAPVAPERRRRVIARELLIALAFLLVFLFAGGSLLAAVGISEATLTVAGGVILFLIALRMLFPPPGGIFPADTEEGGDEPFLVPLAVPLVAGPSALAAVLFIMNSDPERWPEWLAAVVLAWAASGAVLLLSTDLVRVLKRRGLIAIERLMGMVLTAVATKLILTGLADFFGL
ncbi:MarC family protein [Rubrivirga sp. S365]|uniref:MarC family protein n=1 Tax=Rubrivirga sp. S365 TaxID=3076080 RepID=UPI0028C5195A|nr:MarC family protein [Rubrivirga sp. S365]MDT7857378.1 MarC family protein [Rubrivirga sp. S365]